MLLDTHIFLWWLFDDNRLPPKIREHIQNIDNPVFVSAASVWEIVTKFRSDKLPEAEIVAKNVPLWIEQAGIEIQEQSRKRISCVPIVLKTTVSSSK